MKYESGRPSELEILKRIALNISLRSTCSRARVGAVIHDQRGVIVSTGRNGAPSRMKHCDHPIGAADEGGCETAIHAELNAIVWAARRGVPAEGLHLVSTLAPCAPCARAIVQAGITQVVYISEYRTTAGLDVLAEAGVPALHSPIDGNALQGLQL